MDRAPLTWQYREECKFLGSFSQALPFPLSPSLTAGYDSHFSDPLASMQLTAQGYYAMSHDLAVMAAHLCGQGRLLYVLEGGYHLPAIGPCVVSSMKGLAAGAAEAAQWGGNDTAQGGWQSVDAVAGEEAMWLQPEPLEKVQLVLDRVKHLHRL